MNIENNVDVLKKQPDHQSEKELFVYKGNNKCISKFALQEEVSKL